MTETMEGTVPSGAIATALMLVESMHGRVDDNDADTAEALTIGVQRWGRDTMLDAFSLLIYTAVHAVPPNPEAEQNERLHLLLPSIVDRFHQLQLPQVPDEMLPVVAGILTAASLDRSPYEWRTGIGPIGDREGMVWAYTAWLLTDFLDNVVYGERPGAFAEILRKVLDIGPPEDEAA